MITLRLALVLGLIFHKFVWEVMKRGEGVPGVSRRPSPGPRKRLLKYVKAGVLIFLVFQTLFLDLFPISNQPTPLRIIGTAVYCLGLAMAVIGRLQLGNNWANLEDFQVLPEQSLVRNGIYNYVRHPIYAGDATLLIGLQLALNSWLVLGMLIPLVVIVRQALVEEALLSQKFGDYPDYARKTKRFVPFLL